MVGQGLRFSHNDQSVKVINLFIQDVTCRYLIPIVDKNLLLSIKVNQSVEVINLFIQDVTCR